MSFIHTSPSAAPTLAGVSVLPGSGGGNPAMWANSCDKAFAERMKARQSSPPDGHRSPRVATRRHAPEGWMGFMVLDCGYETLPAAQIHQEMVRDSDGAGDDDDVLASKVALWLMGRNEAGESVCLWIHHLVPYFYVGISHPDPRWAETHAPRYAKSLLTYLRNEAHAAHWKGRPTILDVKPVKRRWFYGYRSDPSRDKRQPDWASGLRQSDGDATAWEGDTTQASDWYLKVSAGAPYDVNKLREWAATWARYQAADAGADRATDRWRVPVVRTTSTIMAPVDLTVFEANVEFALRCMIDLGLVGCGWCVFDRGHATPARGWIPRPTVGKRSRCQHEYAIDGRIFERAAVARDRALNAGADPWEAIHQALYPGTTAGGDGVMNGACLRFVARQDDLQRYVDGTGKGTCHVDPMEDWFQDLREATAPLTIMTFDIECCNNRGSFPQPDEEDGQVINLAARVYRLDRVEAYERARARLGQTASGDKGKECVEKEGEEEEEEDGLEGIDPARCKWPPPFDAVVFGLGTREPMREGGMDGYPVASFSFADERELLIAFGRLILQWDPDLIEGYNSVAFDMAFLLIRAQTLGISDVFWKLGRLLDRKSAPREQSFGNKAKGKRKEYRAHLHGRVQFDLMRVCFDDIAFKPRDYRLNNVAKELINEGKLDLKYKLIPIKHHGTDATRRELDEYCDADAVLPFKIERHQSYLMRYIELARVTGVPLRFLLTKGQQILVYTQILRKARQESYAVPWLPVVEPERSLKEARKTKAYEGAVVISPKVGFYTIDRTGPVVVNDYNSLYPGSMISQNLGYTTHITDKIAAEACRRIHKRERDQHDEDVRKHDQWYEGELLVRSYEEQGGWKVAPVESKTRKDPVFVRPTVRKSLIAEILEALLAARTVAKKLMKTFPKGSATYKVQDARQMALKVCCNSVYGFTGAPVGRQPNLDISGATTGYGRKALYFAKWLAEELLPGENDVVYGDSVVGETPIIIQKCKENGTPSMVRIEDLCPRGDSRWERQTSGKYVVDSRHLGWQVWSDRGWTAIKRVIRHKTRKSLYRITTARGSIVVTEDHSLLLADGTPIKPQDAIQHKHRLLHVKNLPQCPMAAALRKEFDDDTTALDAEDISNMLFKHAPIITLGMAVSISDIPTFNESVHLWFSSTATQWDDGCVYNRYYQHIDGRDAQTMATAEAILSWELITLSEPVWVYDLETENHHFAAGHGFMVVHNTDSVMVQIKDACTGEKPDPGKPLSERAIAAVKMAFERGHLLDEEINKRVIPPMRIETEKVYAPFLLLGRKKYMTLMWMRPDAPFDVDAKGIEMVRRDNPHIVGMACEAFADLLMGKGDRVPGTSDQREGLWHDLETAKELLRQVHKQILEDKLPFEAYIISAKFSKPANEYDTVPPHIALAVRMQERDPGSAPQLGNRIPYVLVRPEFTQAVKNHEKSVLYKNDLRSVKIRDQAEDPQWAQEHGMRIDTDTYAHNKFEPPFLRMLAPILAPGELQNGQPKDPGMYTRQNWRHRNDPAKLQEWIQNKRQQNAEDVVHREIFADNYRHRKIRKTVHADCAIERSFARAGRGTDGDGESDALHDPPPPPSQQDMWADIPEVRTEEDDADALLALREMEIDESEEQESLEDKSAKERIQALLDVLVERSKEVVSTKCCSAPPVNAPPAPRRQRQAAITRFFQKTV